MARRVGDPVEVRVVGGCDATPTSFLWHNRLYVVREVLGHWREHCEWWSGAAARAVHGEKDSAVGVLDLDQEMWRVEASPGRTFGSGVYDLCRAAPTEQRPEEQPVQGWRLVRVAD